MKNTGILLGLAFIFVFQLTQSLWPNEGQGHIEKRLKEASLPSEKLAYLCELVTASRQEYPLKAIKYGDRALNILQNHPDNQIKVKILNGMCWAYGVSGKYAEALDIGKEAENLARGINDKKELAVTLGSIANVYLNLSEYAKALDYSQKAIAAAEAVGYKKGIASALVSTARIHRHLKEYDKALADNKKALVLSKELGETTNVAWIQNNIGAVYWDLKKYHKALDYFFFSLKLMKETGSEKGHAFLLSNIACVYSDMGKYAEALRYDLQALEISEKLGNKMDIAFALSNVGRSYGNLKGYRKGLDYLDKSLKMASRMGIKELMGIIFNQYTQIHKARGDYKKALHYHEKYKEAEDDIFDKDKNRRIAHLQVIYGVEKKQKENQLLKKNNRIQRLELEHRGLELDRQKMLGYFLILVTFLIALIAVITFNRYRIRKKAQHVLMVSEQKLKRMNDAKDRLFAIIAHDLGNPLSSLLLSSGHLHRHLSRLSEQDLEDFIQDIYQQTQGLSDLLENLLQWAMVQTGKIEHNPETVDMRLLTEETVNQIKYTAQKKKIRVVSNVLDNTIAWADKYMMKAVIRNLLSNAVKYTHPDGEIVISSTDSGNWVEISVSDNGVGVAPEVMERLFQDEIHKSTQGTENEKGTGLGLTLCKEFIENNGGKIRSTAGFRRAAGSVLPYPSSLAEMNIDIPSYGKRRVREIFAKT